MTDRNEGAAEGAIGGCSKCGGDIGPLASGRHVCPAEGDCVLVPREPTEAMIEAVRGLLRQGVYEPPRRTVLSLWAKFLSAAPASPGEGGRVSVSDYYRSGLEQAAAICIENGDETSAVEIRDLSLRLEAALTATPAPTAGDPGWLNRRFTEYELPNTMKVSFDREADGLNFTLWNEAGDPIVCHRLAAPASPADGGGVTEALEGLLLQLDAYGARPEVMRAKRKLEAALASRPAGVLGDKPYTIHGPALVVSPEGETTKLDSGDVMTIARPAVEGNLVEALEGFEDDYMTSEKHHPGYVLIPIEMFRRIRDARAAPKAHGGEE